MSDIQDHTPENTATKRKTAETITTDQQTFAKEMKGISNVQASNTREQDRKNAWNAWQAANPGMAPPAKTRKLLQSCPPKKSAAGGDSKSKTTREPKAEAKESSPPLIPHFGDITDFLGEDVNALIDFSEEKSREIVMVDPAGAAFRGDSGKYFGSGLSGSLYKNLGIEGTKHAYSQVKEGTAFLNGLVFEHNYNKDISVKVIHAMGPNGRNISERIKEEVEKVSKNFPDYEERKDLVESTIDRQFNVCMETAVMGIAEQLKITVDAKKQTIVCIPIISGGIHKPSNKTLEEHMYNFLVVVYKHLVHAGYNIVLGIYTSEEREIFKKITSDVDFQETCKRRPLSRQTYF